MPIAEIDPDIAGLLGEGAFTLSTLGLTCLNSGDLERARAHIAEALELFQRCGHGVGEAITHLQLGQVEAQRGQSDAARVHLVDALAIAKQIKHAETEGEADQEEPLGDSHRSP